MHPMLDITPPELWRLISWAKVGFFGLSKSLRLWIEASAGVRLRIGRPFDFNWG